MTDTAVTAEVKMYPTRYGCFIKVNGKTQIGWSRFLDKDDYESDEQLTEWATTCVMDYAIENNIEGAPQ